MTVSASSPTTTPVSTWTIDPSHTLVEFSVKHMMFTTVKGRFTGVQGSIQLDESDISRSSVEATIDTATVITGDQKRDEHLRSADFFDVERFPQATFKSTRIEPVGSNKAKIYGDLTIRDVTHQVELDAELHGQGKNPYGMTVAGFTAETTINRKDWGLNWNVALEAGGWLVSDTFKLLVEVQAVKQES